MDDGSIECARVHKHGCFCLSTLLCYSQLKNDKTRKKSYALSWKVRESSAHARWRVCLRSPLESRVRHKCNKVSGNSSLPFQRVPLAGSFHPSSSRRWPVSSFKYRSRPTGLTVMSCRRQLARLFRTCQPPSIRPIIVALCPEPRGYSLPCPRYKLYRGLYFIGIVGVYSRTAASDSYPRTRDTANETVLHVVVKICVPFFPLRFDMLSVRQQKLYFILFSH